MYKKLRFTYYETRFNLWRPWCRMQFASWRMCGYSIFLVVSFYMKCFQMYSIPLFTEMHISLIWPGMLYWVPGKKEQPAVAPSWDHRKVLCSSPILLGPTSCVLNARVRTFLIKPPQISVCYNHARAKLCHSRTLTMYMEDSTCPHYLQVTPERPITRTCRPNVV
jgi:hypothetical protein